MVVKILGSGCKSCMTLYDNFKKVIGDNRNDIEVLKITDFKEIMKYRVMQMPAVVIDEKVVSQGKILKEEEIKNIINGKCNNEDCKCGEKCNCGLDCNC